MAKNNHLAVGIDPAYYQGHGNLYQRNWHIRIPRIVLMDCTRVFLCWLWSRLWAIVAPVNRPPGADRMGHRAVAGLVIS